MSAVSRVLQKSILIPFYRSHAGLLIFIYLIMFGTVESNQLVTYHRTLITGMFTSEIFLIAVCIVWALYSLKILQYILLLLQKPEYSFLTDLMLVSRTRSFSQILWIITSCFLPVLLYSVFIYLIGISQHYYEISIGLFLFQTALCCVNAYVIIIFIRTQHRFSWTIAKFRMRVEG
jgi:hypothetical protein